ncbi:30S ribosomal protein S20 [Patescibacteria group bacterium]|nr:30S ribosomal protein S20 [Patescibacteria group bacterium]MBU0964522.1 30S ribosomal protein S20 [Patescibacteria group bacterium]
MPIKKAAKKHLRQTKKRTIKNLGAKNRIKAAIKSARLALTNKDKSKAQEQIKKTIKILDKAAQNKILKKNTASRFKSRLMKQLNKLK